MLHRNRSVNAPARRKRGAARGGISRSGRCGIISPGYNRQHHSTRVLILHHSDERKMIDPLTKPCTGFAGHRLLHAGPLATVAIAVKRSAETTDAVLVFDDATGRVFDLDLRGGESEILERLSRPATTFTSRYRPPSASPSDAAAEAAPGERSRGRPKLGVVAREVTLLPRHWDWLAEQPGGASVTLRRLVDEARKAPHPRQHRRAAQEAAYHFMQAIAGDLPGYEDATRALFADDRQALEARIAGWPDDILAYALRLAFGASVQPTAE
jgi:hypothetical protein